MRIVAMFVLSLFVVACGSPTVENKQEISKSKINITDFLKEQVLLTNEAYFSEERALYGASAFLIDYNNKKYGVTAKHLIGSDGGVEPEVPATELSANLILWKAYPRVKVEPKSDTLIFNTDKLNYVELKSDILLLNVANTGFNAKTLRPSFEIPKLNDKLYLVGCPYSEENCRQNSYEITFVEYDQKGAKLVFEMKDSIELPGFSGAPVINEQGEVVGVLTSGGPVDGKYYLIATAISEVLTIIE